MDPWLEMLDEQLKMRGLKRSQLARLTGISQAAISCWFKGIRNPTKLSRVLVEKALGLRPETENSPDVVLRNAIYSHPRLSKYDVDDIMALVNAKLSRGGNDEM